jgi:hypothetical protein
MWYNLPRDNDLRISTFECRYNNREGVASAEREQVNSTAEASAWLAFNCETYVLLYVGLFFVFSIRVQ